MFSFFLSTAKMFFKKQKNKKKRARSRREKQRKTSREAVKMKINWVVEGIRMEVTNLTARLFLYECVWDFVFFSFAFLLVFLFAFTNIFSLLLFLSSFFGFVGVISLKNLHIVDRQSC